MPINKTLQKAKKDWKLDLDQIIEDMESYIETESNLSYQDELHNRLLLYGLVFMDTRFHQIHKEAVEEDIKILESLINEGNNVYLNEALNDGISKLKQKLESEE